MRVPLENVSVLEGSRLALVGIDHEIPGLRSGPGNEGPLLSGRKACAAQTAEVRTGDLVDDLRRRHRQRLPGSGVPSAGDVRIQPGPVRILEPRRKHGAVGGQVRHRARGFGPERRIVRAPAAETRLERAALQRSDELIVELRHGRHLARAQALDLGERQLATGGCLTRTDPQAILELGEHVPSTAQHARQARADAKLSPSRRLCAEHRVERNRLPDVGHGQAREASHPVLRFGRNMAEALLDQPQQRQHGCPRLVVTMDDRPGVWFERVRGSPVQLTPDHVDRPECRSKVRDHVSDEQPGKGRHDGEAGWTDAHTVRDARRHR